jgi:hypothetical protein
VDKLKSRGLNGCSDMLWTEEISDIQRLWNQQDEMWNILMLACSRSR